MRRFIGLFALAIWVAGIWPGARAMPWQEPTTVPSDVRDGAKLFSEDAIRSAREALDRIEKEIGAPVLIETIDSLEGDDVDQVAARLARRSGTQGVYVLIARKEAKLEVLPSRRYEAALPREGRSRVRAALTDAFRDRAFDKGLIAGIASLGAELGAAKKAGRLPTAEQASEEAKAPARALVSAPPGPKPLVRRDRVHLTLEGARTIIAAATRQAMTMNLKVNIAVVDDGGTSSASIRMDDARPASGYTAITKATTAATFRQPSGPVPAGTASPDPLLNLSLQLAAQASGGKLTTLYGGVPVVVDDQVIGGVGVGGGSGEQDTTVARAGIQALLEALGVKPPPGPAERK